MASHSIACITTVITYDYYSMGWLGSGVGLRFRVRERVRCFVVRVRVRVNYRFFRNVSSGNRTRD